MRLFKNIEEPIIAGIMTGTSLDGVDVAIIKFFAHNNDFHFQQLAFNSYKYNNDFKAKLISIIEKKASIEIISEVNVELAYIYSDSILELCRDSSINLNDIDAIGMHGQTVWHNPDSKIPNTFQIGSVSALSKILNKIVVGDFRVADIILGGEGAPLVPIFDYHFLRSQNEDRIILNIGGIANITYLPKGCSIDDVKAFDTGPGNALIDIFSKKYFGLDFDSSGNIASKGYVIDYLLNKLKENPFIIKPPPKSTGKEFFNQEYILNFLNSLNLHQEKPENIIRTLTEFTIWSIVKNIQLFCSSNATIIASGGGIHNNFLMKRLNEELLNYTIHKSDVFGINPDAKEAICFAFLAYLTLYNLPGNITSVTGAKRRTILGVISLPD